MKKMINRWLEKEIINQELANVMLKDIEEEKARKSRIKLNICIYTIATILIGIGVLAFISANDWLLKIFTDTPVLQIVVMLILTISSLFFGYKMAYETNKFPKLGHSMIFLSSLLIGGTYALTGQNYNINANNSGLCFLWMISIIPVAYVFKNFAINIVAIILYILGVIFYYLELSIDNGDTWTIFIPIILGVSFYTIGNIPAIVDKFEKFSLTYKIIGLKLIYFVLLICEKLLLY